MLLAMHIVTAAKHPQTDTACFITSYITCCFFADNAPLTDEDRELLKRWQQMQPQQQHPSVTNSVSISSTEGTTTVTTTSVVSSATTTTAAGVTLQLCSADSRLADQCLADTDLIWTPSISLSSADIASCLQPSDNPSTVGHTADGGGDSDNCAAMDTQQQCCAGYGVGEIISADKYAAYNNSNNNNKLYNYNNQDNVYSTVLMAVPLQKFTRFM